MWRSRTRFNIFAALAMPSVLIATGCGVLTIDVDVYKGPLANHENVQTEQVAAMAIGAKPMLLKLRDQLEACKRGINNDSDLALAPQVKDWYKPNFVPPPADVSDWEEKWFRSDHARRVNAILGLYEDQTSEAVQAYIDRASELMERLSAALAVFEPDPPTDVAFWQEIEQYMIDGGNENSRLSLLPIVKQVEQPIVNLRVAFNALRLLDLVPAPPWPKLPLEAAIQAIDDDIRARDAIIDAYRRVRQSSLALRESYRAFFDPQRGETRYPWDVAETHELLSGHLEELTLVARTIQQQSKGSQDVQIQARDLLRILNNIDDPPGFKGRGNDNLRTTNYILAEFAKGRHASMHAGLVFRPNTPDRVVQDFVRRAVEISKAYEVAREAIDDMLVLGLEGLRDANRPDARERLPNLRSFNEKVATVLSRVVKTGDLRIFIANQGADSTASKNLAERRTRLKLDFGKINGANDDPWATSRENFIRLILDDPHHVSQELLSIHRSFKRVYAPSPELSADKRAQKYENDPQRRTYGITLSPLSVDDDSVTEDEVYTIFQAIQNLATGGGLDRGRLPEGIETLIERYLRANHALPPEPTPAQEELVNRTRQQLLDALVNFAEKVLFMANNEEIISTDSRAENSDQYIQMLQAVGNSIIVAIDELAHRAEHKQSLSPRAQTTLDAIRRRYPDFGNRIAKDPRELMDALVARLRVDLVEEIERNSKSSPRAQNIEQAIEKLLKQRADMVFIRPASAFLRNSYPSTSLQSDPQLQWHNMLGRHARKSIPFYAELRDMLHKDERRRAEIQSEIDKQFWQNVNRVRVAGAGITNYVVVKDDLGNFYIKSYSGDPKPIIDGAKNLALFSASASAGVNLIQRAKQAEEGQTPAAVPPGPRSQELDAFIRLHRQQRNEDYNAIVLAAKGLRQRIDTAWAKHDAIVNYPNNAIRNAVAQNEAELHGDVDSLSAKGEGESASSQNIIDALRTVLQYHGRLQSRLNGVPVTAGEALVDARREFDQLRTRELELRLQLAQASDKLDQLMIRLMAEEKDATAKEEKARQEDATAEEKLAATQAREKVGRTRAEISIEEGRVDKLREQIGEIEPKVESAQAALDTAKTRDGELRAVAAAREIVDRVIQTDLTRHIERRRSAARQFETTLHVLNDPKSAQSQ